MAKFIPWQEAAAGPQMSQHPPRSKKINGKPASKKGDRTEIDREMFSFEGVDQEKEESLWLQQMDEAFKDEVPTTGRHFLEDYEDAKEAEMYEEESGGSDLSDKSGTSSSSSSSDEEEEIGEEDSDSPEYFGMSARMKRRARVYKLKQKSEGKTSSDKHRRESRLALDTKVAMSKDEQEVKKLVDKFVSGKRTQAYADRGKKEKPSVSKRSEDVDSDDDKDMATILRSKYTKKAQNLEKLKRMLHTNIM